MKTRIVQTRFWKDEYITTLSTEEKLVFLYLITNDNIELTGIYQLYPQEIAMWCGLEPGEAERILIKFCEDKKIVYADGWVKILNVSKYQNYNSGTREKAFQRELDLTPLSIRSTESSVGSTLGAPLGRHLADRGSSQTTNNKNKKNNIYINNQKEKRKTKQKEKRKSSVHPRDFFAEESPEREFVIAGIAEKQNIPLEGVREEIEAFVLYWTEPNASGQKLRWQLEKTFEVRRRLGTWLKRSQQHRQYAHKSYQNNGIIKI